MYFPQLQQSQRHKEITTVFGGYNHTLSCLEGQFYDMTNLSSEHFPILSVRRKRGIVKIFEKFQGMLNKSGIVWIDDGKLYIDSEHIKLDTQISEGYKRIVKMGAYIVIFPDNIFYNTSTKEHGHLDVAITIPEGATIKFTMCDSSGAVITPRNSDYYKNHAPKDGDYLIFKNNGKHTLKVYSETTSVWSSVISTYTQIEADGIGKNFKPQDGIKLSLSKKFSELSDIFINNEEDGTVSTNTTVIDCTEDSITIPGIIGKDITLETKDDEGEVQKVASLKAERKVPVMSFVTECYNRLWGCSPDGHEIYCCKLGDVTNWNSFQGISDDSWVATIGSDGEFTGATTYDGFPIFFKEDRIIKIGVSSSGAHQIKEIECRGVQKGSDRSIALLNETLFYKSALGVCAYNGGMPYNISDVLGQEKYKNAVGGAFDGKYYISMENGNRHHLFIYDLNNNIWCKEDDVNALEFCDFQNDLFLVDNNNTMYSVYGTLLKGGGELREEEDIMWSAESGDIGYSSPEYKYVAKISLKIALGVNSYVDFWIRYNGAQWEHKFNVSGQGSRTFTIPLIPRRCDHFNWKISGKGECKIYSITKTIEGGSDT